MAGRRSAPQEPTGTMTVDASVEPEQVDTPTEDYPERSYADALTPEHAEVLRKAGQHPEDQG